MTNKRPPDESTEVPREFPDVEPHELFPTNNIRFVISETAKLIERVDGLKQAVSKSEATSEKTLDKHAASTKEKISDLKSDVKELGVKVERIKESIDSFKGAMKVFAGLYALALVLMGGLLAWYLRPVPTAPAQAVAPAQASQPVPIQGPPPKISN